MRIKRNHLSILLSGILIFVAAYAKQINADPNTKKALEGTWCLVEDESFIFYEHSKDALTLKKGQGCRTFKVLKQTESGGGGRFLEVLEKPDMKHQIAAVEKSESGKTIAKDIGIFAYMKTGDKIRLVAVDVSDESVVNLTLDSSGKMYGFIEEVTSDTQSTQDHDVVVKSSRTPL
ncbi:hypothetical protein [Microbulbifer epialgicus]|uniref:Lipocalin-like domain-containing protein n=1 Tax=Microbulbifer epialgicus TaxID=393907 RepID=A0ABV4P6Q6_9GAMM